MSSGFRHDVNESFPLVGCYAVPCLILENGTDRLLPNISNYFSTPCNITEE